MHNRSDYLKNSGAAAARAATTLNGLARNPDLSIADQGVLLAAAAIANRLAGEKKRDAKAEKAKEIAFEKALQEAKTALDKLIRIIPAAGNPPADVSIDDAVSFCFAAGGNANMLRFYLNEARRIAHRSVRWHLDSVLEDTRRELVSSLSYEAVRESRTPQAVLDRFLDKLRSVSQREECRRLADTYRTLINAEIPRAA